MTFSSMTRRIVIKISRDQHLDVKNGCTHLIHVNGAFAKIFGGRR
jgi:hypothetical protein